MLDKIARQTVGQSVWISLSLITVWCVAYVVGGEALAANDEVYLFGGINRWARVGLGAVLIFGASLVVARSVIRYSLVEKLGGVSLSLSTAVLLCATPPSSPLSSPLCALLFALSNYYFFGSLRRRYSFNNLFVASFCLGLIVVLSPKSVGLLLLVVCANIIFDRTGRELIVSVVGSLTPLFLALYICWAVYGDLGEAMRILNFEAIGKSTNFVHLVTPVNIGAFAVTVFCLCITLPLYVRDNEKMKARSSKSLLYVIVESVVILLIITIPMTSTLLQLVFAAIISSFSICYIISEHTKFGTILYLLFLFLSLFAAIMAL